MAIATRENEVTLGQNGSSPADYQLIAEGYIAYHVANSQENMGLDRLDAYLALNGDPVLKSVQRRDINKVLGSETLTPSEFPRALAKIVRTGNADVQRELRIWTNQPMQSWEIQRARRLQGLKK